MSSTPSKLLGYNAQRRSDSLTSEVSVRKVNTAISDCQDGQTRYAKRHGGGIVAGYLADALHVITVGTKGINPVSSQPAVLNRAAALGDFLCLTLHDALPALCHGRSGA